MQKKTLKQTKKEEEQEQDIDSQIDSKKIAAMLNLNDSEYLTSRNNFVSYFWLFYHI